MLFNVGFLFISESASHFLYHVFIIAILFPFLFLCLCFLLIPSSFDREHSVSILWQRKVFVLCRFQATGSPSTAQNVAQRYMSRVDGGKTDLAGPDSMLKIATAGRVFLGIPYRRSCEG